MTDEVKERLWQAIDNNDLETLLQILSEEQNETTQVSDRHLGRMGRSNSPDVGNVSDTF